MFFIFYVFWILKILLKGSGECKIRKRMTTICQVQRFKTRSTCVLVVIPFLTTSSYFFSGYYLWINYFKSCWLHSQGIYPVRLITYTNIQFKDKNKSLSLNSPSFRYCSRCLQFWSCNCHVDNTFNWHVGDNIKSYTFATSEWLYHSW